MKMQEIATAIAAALLTFGGGGVLYQRTKHGKVASVEEPTDNPETVDILLSRIGELETALGAERSRASELEVKVQRLREERRELASRVTHLEGQVVALTQMVQGLMDGRG